MEALLLVTAATPNASFQHTVNMCVLTFSVLQLSVSRSFRGLHLLPWIVSCLAIEAWDTEVHGTVFGVEWVVMVHPACVAPQNDLSSLDTKIRWQIRLGFRDSLRSE